MNLIELMKAAQEIQRQVMSAETVDVRQEVADLAAIVAELAARLDSEFPTE